MPNANGGTGTPGANGQGVGATTVTVDVSARVVRFEQMATPFNIKPDVVVVPFDQLKIMAAQLVLVEAGVLAVGPPPDATAQEAVVREAEAALKRAGVIPPDRLTLVQ